METDHRRLLARAVRAEENAQQLRERLAAAYQEIAAVRAKVPVKVHQVSFAPAPAAAPSSDPLARLFAAIAPPPMILWALAIVPLGLAAGVLLDPSSPLYLVLARAESGLTIALLVDLRRPPSRARRRCG